VSKEKKVKHVKSQGQTRHHHCHWPNCPKQCPPAMWGCYYHWMKLPKSLRDKIWAAYRIGQEKTMTPSREYLAAAREAQEWIRSNYPNG
jgi:CDP-diacylglycerol pyrophosphatase